MTLLTRDRRAGGAASIDADSVVAFCGGKPWDGVRGTDRQLVSCLAQRTPVLFVEPTMSLTQLIRPGLERRTFESVTLHNVTDNLVRATPVVPPASSRLRLRPVALAITRRVMAHAVRRLGVTVSTLVVARPEYLFGHLRESRRVFYATDDFIAGASLMGLPQRRIEAAVQRLAHDADAVVTISDALGQKWRRYGAEPVVIPNGVDPVPYANLDMVQAADDVVLRPPVAGFVGHINRRINLTLLDALAERGHSVLLVGPIPPTGRDPDIARLLRLPTVQWVGVKPYEDLPSYLKWIDVGLVPYVDTEFNRGSFPLKALEYLAAGRPCVTTGIPALSAMSSGDVSVAHGRDDFVRAVEQRLTERRDDSAVRRRQALASQHSWADRALRLEHVLFDTADAADPP